MMIHHIALHTIHQMPVLIMDFDKNTIYGCLKNHELCIH